MKTKTKVLRKDRKIWKKNDRAYIFQRSFFQEFILGGAFVELLCDKITNIDHFAPLKSL